MNLMCDVTGGRDLWEGCNLDIFLSWYSSIIHMHVWHLNVHFISYKLLWEFNFSAGWVLVWVPEGNELLVPTTYLSNWQTCFSAINKSHFCLYTRLGNMFVQETRCIEVLTMCPSHSFMPMFEMSIEPCMSDITWT